MEHPFFATNAPTRAEALRWLTIAEKLLSTRDLMGSKSFASRAHDSDPTLTQANQILAVADTLLAGDIRIGNNNHDWYSILGLTPSQGRDSDLVATQYRNLALLLNPQNNKFAYTDQAFRLVIEAWSVLSNPSRKMIYDKEMLFFNQGQGQPDLFNSNPVQQNNNNNMFLGGNNSNRFGNVENMQGRPEVVELFQEQQPQYTMNFNTTQETANENVIGSSSGVAFQEGVNLNEQTNNYSPASDNNDNNPDADENVEVEDVDEMNVEDEEEDEEGVDEPVNEYSGPTIWTACPYCFCMFEYPDMFADCCMKCQKCRRAFQAVVIPSPPENAGKEDSFYCWGFMPLGLSMASSEKNNSAAPAWSPFSPMFSVPQFRDADGGKKGGGRKDTGPRVFVGDDEVFLEFSESDESDGNGGRRRSERSNKRRGHDVGKGTPNKSSKNAPVENVTNVDVQFELGPSNEVEMHGNVTVEKGMTPSKATVGPSKNNPTLNKATAEPSKNGNVTVEKGTTPSKATGGPSKNNHTLNKATAEPSKNGAVASARKQPVRGSQSFGNLDLNMECSNEAEEPRMRKNLRSRMGRIENENIEGVGFFEGLDDYLSNLPILNNVVGDVNAVKAA